MLKNSNHDSERRERVGDVLKEHQLDAVVCALPSHVLLLSGYFPVVGTSFAIATREQQIIVIAPEDEQELAQAAYADAIIAYKPGRLDRLQAVNQAAVPPLRDALRRLRLEQSRIGFENGPVSEPASYSAMNFFGGAVRTMLQEAAPQLLLDAADEMLDVLASVKTPREVDAIRLACKVAERAFQDCSRQLRPGMSEFEAAALLRSGFSVQAAGFGVARPEGFAWCMSGPNSAEAARAYARSRDRHLAPGDIVLMHANSCADGYWTDITRSYTLGAADDRKRQLYSGIFQAREAALQAIRPGVLAREVDAAARDTLARFGYAQEFKHSTGHGVGFSAISANALPRLHPASQDVLEVGMVFNVEPAVYFEGYGGIRHCDMVVVGPQGAEVLTEFQNGLEELAIR
jgi:Xaa-Pro aminopeptidase